MPKYDPTVPRARTRWTAEEDSQLLASFADTSSFDSLAKLFQRTRGAIIARLEGKGYLLPQGDGWVRAQPNREFLPGHNHNAPWLEADKELVARLFQQGMDIFQIATRLARKPTSCASRLCDQGFLVNVAGRYYKTDLNAPETLPNDVEALRRMVQIGNRLHSLDTQPWCNLNKVIPTGDPEILR